MSVDPILEMSHAREALEKGDFPQAERRFRQILAARPNDAGALHGLGALAMHADSFVAALDYLRRAEEVRPMDSAILADLATTYFYLERMGEAEAKYRAALDIVGQHSEMSIGLGLAVKHQGRLDEARQVFAQAMDDFPDDPWISMNLAGIAFEMDDFEAAIEYYQRTIELKPGEADVWVSLSTAQVSLGRLADANGSLDRAIGLNPNHTRALSNKIALAYALGQEDVLDRLLDYDTVIQAFPLQAPPQSGGIEAFNSRLLAAIRAHPTLLWCPPSKSTRNGSQTANLLTGTVDAAVNMLADHVMRAVHAYGTRAAQAAGATLPIAVPERFGLRCWGTLLDAEGHQAPHTHPSAIVSAVYHVALPDSVRRDDSITDGWLQFGRPGLPVEPRLDLRLRLQRPVEGTLVLFPSYLWHETVPFSSKETRASIAFDAIPA